VQLVKLADNIAHKLSYFNELDKMTKKFYSPSLSVLEERFLPLLRRLDECIEFVATNVSTEERKRGKERGEMMGREKMGREKMGREDGERRWGEKMGSERDNVLIK
jgi:hypothetical protein